MRKIRVIVVDDEQEARNGLKLLLDNDQEVEVLKICKNGIEAIDALNDFKVDLMFLDVQMPGIDGFEVIKNVSKENIPFVIFCTAYDQYALEAFRVHAFDYLLKPFTDKAFYDSLHRAKDLIQQKETQQKLEGIFNLASSERANTNSLLDEGIASIDRLIVKENDKVHFVKLEDIHWIEAFDYYVKIHVEGHFYLLRESMKKLETKLPPARFGRIHRSSIVNLDKIKNIEIIGNGEYLAHLQIGETLKVSRSYKQCISHLLR